jgi:hypothetical protein
VHPFGDLSAYIDGALGREARAFVESHLGTCAACRARVAELRATARLIAGLPAPVPTRSLVPRVSVPFWLAPLRTLSTIASGAAIFLFIASAVLSMLPNMASGTATGGAAAPAAAPAPNASSADQGRGAAGGATPSPGAAFSVGGSAQPSPAPSASPDARSTLSDNATKSFQSASASPAAESAPRSDAVAAERTRLNAGQAQPQLGPSPWFWLALGIGFGAIALLLQRRLRTL